MGLILSWSVTTAVTLLLASIVSSQVVDIGASVQPRTLTMAAICALLGALLAPPHGPRYLWIVVISAAGSVAIMAMVDLSVDTTARLWAVLAVTTYALSAVCQALQQHLDPTRSAAVVTAAAIALCAAPLFLGPLAEVFAEQRWLANGIVFISPLSHLAAWLDYDYLRNPWFYQASRFGGLRFEYPSPFATIATGAALGLACDGWSRHRQTATRTGFS